METPWVEPVAPASVPEVASEVEAPEVPVETSESLVSSPESDELTHDDSAIEDDSAVEMVALTDLTLEQPTWCTDATELEIESTRIENEADPGSIASEQDERWEAVAEPSLESIDAVVREAVPLDEPALELDASLENAVATSHEPSPDLESEAMASFPAEVEVETPQHVEVESSTEVEVEATPEVEVELKATPEVEVELKATPEVEVRVELEPKPGIKVETTPEVEVDTEVPPTPLKAPNQESSEESESEFVTDACLVDPAEIGVAKPEVDLSTCVHDAYGHTNEGSTSVPPPRRSATDFTAQTDAKAVRSPLPELGRPSPHGSTTRPGPEASTSETVPPPSSRDWPSARDILASHRASVQRAAAPRPTLRTPFKAAVLTELQEPAHWSVPLWLGWPPTFLVVFVAGLLGLYLSWIWSVDARWSGTVAGVLARSGANVKPLPETIPVPSGSWWKSNSANLMLWSTYFDRRAAAEPVHGERADELLSAASQASPIQAQTRFAMARRTNPRDEAPGAALTASLGLSQDVEAQAWLGRQLLQSGKKEAALKAYRRALEMASRAEVVRHTTPTFDDDAQVLRYHLPGEDLAKRVVRDMAEQTNWTFADWKEALPSFALIPLSVARLFRQQGSSDADVALDLIIDRLDEPAPDGSSKVLHLAAQAEALAFKARWKEAESRYREAIEQMPIDLINRSWWLNLAEIDRRLNDESGRQTALGMAKGLDANDEIAQRAVDQLKFTGTRADRARAQR